MKLRKFAKILLSCVLAGALFTGCSDSAQQEAEKPGNNFSDKDVQLGMLTKLNTNGQQMTTFYDELSEKAGLHLEKHNVPKFYENLRTMQMAVEAGEIQEISVYKCVADYIVKTNDKFEVVQNNALEKLRDSFCFAVRKDDTQLKADLDRIIGEMKADGSLDKLIDEYITKVSKGEVIPPPAVDIPKFDGASTIKVGITGDLPPLDLVLADNKPAGFNTALLAEIAKRLGRNIEVVQVETGGRAIALTSKHIDVVFWAVIPLGGTIPTDIDKPKGLELSTPYFEDHVAHIKLKDKK